MTKEDILKVLTEADHYNKMVVITIKVNKDKEQPDNYITSDVVLQNTGIRPVKPGVTVFTWIMLRDYEYERQMIYTRLDEKDMFGNLTHKYNKYWLDNVVEAKIIESATDMDRESKYAELRERGQNICHLQRANRLAYDYGLIPQETFYESDNFLTTEYEKCTSSLHQMMGIVTNKK